MWLVVAKKLQSSFRCSSPLLAEFPGVKNFRERFSRSRGGFLQPDLVRKSGWVCRITNRHGSEGLDSIGNIKSHTRPVGDNSCHLVDLKPTGGCL